MRSFTGDTAILAVLTAVIAGPLAIAQTAIVSSEFVRYRPDGNVVSWDRAPKYRELLSPAVARNAHFTFRVTVVFPKLSPSGEPQPEGAPYTVHIAQNPESSCTISLFQESYTEVSGEWVPDKLKLVEMPHGASMAKGQVAQSYLVDVFVPAEAAPNHRFRLEVQFYRGDGWMILPMEIRVRQARVDSRYEPVGALPRLEEPLWKAAEANLRAYACKMMPAGVTHRADTGRALLLRNLREDFNLARQREQPDTRDGVVFMLLKAAGLSDLPGFCEGKVSPVVSTEWWLRSRDYLYQAIAVR